MSSKYYTPEIEDLFIGYQCEIEQPDFSCMGEGSDIWRSIRVSLPKMRDDSIALVVISQVRTPYLTAEQIQAEGFTAVEEKDPFKGKIYKFIKEWDGPGFNEPHKITIEHMQGFYPELTVRSEWESSWNKVDEYLYKGKCPSINEFRKICKLLGI